MSKFGDLYIAQRQYDAQLKKWESEAMSKGVPKAFALSAFTPYPFDPSAWKAMKDYQTAWPGAYTEADQSRLEKRLAKKGYQPTEEGGHQWSEAPTAGPRDFRDMGTESWNDSPAEREKKKLGTMIAAGGK